MARRKAIEESPVRETPVQAVPDPILSGPYEEPKQHWTYQTDGSPQVMPGRRPASYWFKSHRLGSSEGEQLFTETESDDLPLVNRLRADVTRWREAGYRGASEVTKDLLRHWSSDAVKRRLFFCQREAVETIIYLLEIRIPGRSSATLFKDFEVSDADLAALLAGDKPKWDLKSKTDFPRLVDQPANLEWIGLRRLACKMATGSGKTVVMAMLISWAFANRGRNPASTHYPNAVLVMAPNLTVRNRLAVLRPDAVDNYYDEFGIVPSRYREYLNQGKVLVTNWHVFGTRSPHSEGGVSYAVVDKGEEDERAFTMNRLGELAQRLPILVLNDEGHHCWRPRVNAATNELELGEVDDGTADDKKQLQADAEEARVWLDGLDRINNSGLLGREGDRVRPGILAAIDLSATPFHLAGSGYPEGSPFPWIVSDFGLVDAIESGIVKIPRIPVLEQQGEGQSPDPKYFRLWDHVTATMTAADKMGRANFKPDSIYREAQGALVTLFAQWQQRFRDYEAIADARAAIPPAMIVVCHDTKAAEYFYQRISGERVEGEGKEARTVFGTSELGPEVQNEEGVRRTLIITSETLRKLQTSDDSDLTKDDKVAEIRRIVDTIGKAGLPGENIRCVVSVSMLTEGWDANNVTQILGVRPFRSQLLCEQVVGRGLRRRSYDINETTGRLEPEYVDVYGIPFSLIPFKGGEIEPSETEDKPTHRIAPVPGREHLEIKIPLVEGYRYAVTLGAIQCDVSSIERYAIDSDPGAVMVQAVRGYRDRDDGIAEGGVADLEQQDRESYYAGIHEQAIHFRIAQGVMERLIGNAKDAEGEPAPWPSRHLLFPQVLGVVQRYVRERVDVPPGVNRKDLGFAKHVDRVIELVYRGITPAAAASDAPLLPVLNAFDHYVTTADAADETTRRVLPVQRSQLSGVIYLTSPEREAAEILDASEHVESFAGNSRRLGFTIPYEWNNEPRRYVPDFVVRLRGGKTLILEIKGEGGVRWDPNAVQAKTEAAKMWCTAVTNAKRFGEWVYEICHHAPGKDWRRLIERVLAKHSSVEVKPLPFTMVEPAEDEKFRTCIPVLSIREAVQRFGGGGAQEDNWLFEHGDWATFPEDEAVGPGWFIARVRGDSLDPECPDGSWCLFGPPREGRAGEAPIVLVRHRRITDPAYTSNATVRRYRSVPVTDESGAVRHIQVTLTGSNAITPSMEFETAKDEAVRVIAELRRRL